MPKFCEMNVHEDVKTYSVDVKEISRAQEEKLESGTYIEVLSFIKDMFNLVDFSGIIRNSKKTIF